MKPPQQQVKQVDIDALAASIHVLRVRFEKSEEKSKQTEKKLNTLLADFRTARCNRAKIIASQALLQLPTFRAIVLDQDKQIPALEEKTNRHPHGQRARKVPLPDSSPGTRNPRC
jgi:hypothetical protein